MMKKSALFLLLAVLSPWAETKAQNLIPNGDFETVAPLTTAYTLGPPLGAGRYFRTTDASTVSPFWSGVGTGNFLIFDGEVGTGQAVMLSYANIPVSAGSQYYFSADLNNVYANGIMGPDPTVQVRINSMAFPSLTVTVNPDQWVNMASYWTSTVTGNITIEIFQNRGASSLGNDIAIDNVVFGACDPCRTFSPEFSFKDSYCTCENKQFTALEQSPGSSHAWSVQESDATGTVLTGPVYGGTGISYSLIQSCPNILPGKYYSVTHTVSRPGCRTRNVRHVIYIESCLDPAFHVKPEYCLGEPIMAVWQPHPVCSQQGTEWYICRADALGNPIGPWSSAVWGSMVNLSSSITSAPGFYRIKHGVWNDDCGNWTESNRVISIVNCCTGAVTGGGSGGSAGTRGLSAGENMPMATDATFALGVAPNPSDGIFNIKADETIREIEVLTLEGKPVFKKILNVSETSIDLSRLPAGMYILKGKSADGKMAVERISVSR